MKDTRESRLIIGVFVRDTSIHSFGYLTVFAFNMKIGNKSKFVDIWVGRWDVCTRCAFLRVDVIYNGFFKARTMGKLCNGKPL